MFSRKALKNGVGKAERDGSVGQDGQKEAERDEQKARSSDQPRRDHGRRASATGWSRRHLVITACAAHVSAAASRMRLRISFSGLQDLDGSFEDAHERIVFTTGRGAGQMGAGMTTLQHVGVRPSGSDCSPDRDVWLCGSVGHIGADSRPGGKTRRHACLATSRLSALLLPTCLRHRP